MDLVAEWKRRIARIERASQQKSTVYEISSPRRCSLLRENTPVAFGVTLEEARFLASVMRVGRFSYCLEAR